MVKGVEGVVTHSGGGREIVFSYSCLVHGHSVPERGGLHHFDSRVKTFCEERKKRSQITQWGLSNNSMKYNGKKHMCHKVKVGTGNRKFHRTAISTFQKVDSYSVAKRKQEVQDVRSCNWKHIEQDQCVCLVPLLILYLYLPCSQIHRLLFSQVLWTPKQTKEHVNEVHRTRTKRALRSPSSKCDQPFDTHCTT